MPAATNVAGQGRRLPEHSIARHLGRSGIHFDCRSIKRRSLLTSKIERSDGQAKNADRSQTNSKSPTQIWRHKATAVEPGEPKCAPMQEKGWATAGAELRTQQAENAKLRNSTEGRRQGQCGFTRASVFSTKKIWGAGVKIIHHNGRLFQKYSLLEAQLGQLREAKVKSTKQRGRLWWRPTLAGVQVRRAQQLWWKALDAQANLVARDAHDGDYNIVAEANSFSFSSR